MGVADVTFGFSVVTVGAGEFTGKLGMLCGGGMEIAGIAVVLGAVAGPADCG